MGLGGVIGWDRERAHKPAGLRTHALVSGAACMLVSLGAFILNEMAESTITGQLAGDPFKVMEAVITGVSFLGAGTIIRSRGNGPHVEGLTTAASILATDAVGMTVASERLLLAGALTALIVVVLWIPSRTVAGSTAVPR